MRKGRDRKIPIIASCIAKRNSLRLPGGSKKKLPAFGMPAYLPSGSTTEDAESIARHKSLMTTFNDRRRMIVDDNSTLQTIVEQYPALKDCQQVRSLHLH